MWDMLAKLTRVQQSRAFKIAMSIVIVLVCAGLFVTYAVNVARERENLPFQQVSGNMEDVAAEMLAGQETDAKALETAKRETAKALRESAQTLADSKNAIIEGRLSLWAAGIAMAAVCGFLLLVVWLGLGLTFIGVMVLGGAVCGPMIAWGSPWWRGVGLFGAAVMGLGWYFAALIQAARMLLTSSNPVTAIAQNVISEAVRMKVSLVFVVLLILALAGLPGSLDTGSPLRYRVQAFLSYGVEASYWIIAVLVVFLSCATVAYEQRDKIIWQTMTKPVKHWQYVLGKWVGVMMVAGVLLGVSSGGVFLFTEYLHVQPAQGEVRPFLPAEWDQNQGITQDRLILETQVLTARASVPPSLPQINPQGLDTAVVDKIKRIKQGDPAYEDNDANRQKIKEDIVKEEMGKWTAIEPGDRKRFVFQGLKYAREAAVPVILRFKLNAGSNAPTDTYRITLVTAGMPPIPLETRLDQFMSQALPPVAIQMVNLEDGSTDGVVVLEVWNGDPMRGLKNKETMSFPQGGLEVSYPVSSFRANYLRAGADAVAEAGVPGDRGDRGSHVLVIPGGGAAGVRSVLLCRGSGVLVRIAELV